MPTAKADNEVPVVLEPDSTPGHPGHAVPKLPPNGMQLGETVHYFSNDGDVIVVFLDNGSPFRDSNDNEIRAVTSASPPLKLVKPNTNPGFICKCFITPPSGRTVGWSPNSLQSGGNHVVR